MKQSTDPLPLSFCPPLARPRHHLAPQSHNSSPSSPPLVGMMSFRPIKASTILPLSVVLRYSCLFQRICTTISMKWRGTSVQVSRQTLRYSLNLRVATALDVAAAARLQCVVRAARSSSVDQRRSFCLIGFIHLPKLPCAARCHSTNPAGFYERTSRVRCRVIHIWFSGFDLFIFY